MIGLDDHVWIWRSIVDCIIGLIACPRNTRLVRATFRIAHPTPSLLIITSTERQLTSLPQSVLSHYRKYPLSTIDHPNHPLWPRVKVTRKSVRISLNPVQLNSPTSSSSTPVNTWTKATAGFYSLGIRSSNSIQRQRQGVNRRTKRQSQILSRW
jgi:hypothetical protein